MPTQDEYNVAKQRQRKLYTKIDLLNFNLQKVDEIGGVVVSDSFTNDATSDIRRTCALTLVVKDSSFNIQAGSKIWLDKYVQIYIGIENIRNGEIIYTNMGVYMINNPSTVYSATENTMTIQGVDLMAKMTGLRNGNLEGVTYTIPQESDIRGSIIAIVEESGFTKYVVESVSQTVPYDISVDAGTTRYELLSELCDIVANYQMYFDVDGVFHYEKIPSGQNEQVIVDDDIFEGLYINHTVNTSFEDVKNVIEVLGKTHDISHYGGTATVSGSEYDITVSSITTLHTNVVIGFNSPSQLTNPTLKVNSLTAYPIKNEDGTYAELTVTGGYYVVKFCDTYFKFLGQVQPYAKLEETNPDSPFYVDGTVGRIRIVLSGGEYDNIYTDDLAMQRAEWELYTRCRLQDNLVITCVPIYWLDVNWLVEFTLPTETIAKQYLIKNITTDGSISGTQSITLMSYYPYYPSI